MSLPDPPKDMLTAIGQSNCGRYSIYGQKIQGRPTSDRTTFLGNVKLQSARSHRCPRFASSSCQSSNTTASSANVITTTTLATAFSLRYFCFRTELSPCVVQQKSGTHLVQQGLRLLYWVSDSRVRVKVDYLHRSPVVDERIPVILNAEYWLIVARRGP